MKVERNREALVLVEFQNEWLHPAGKLRGLVEDVAQLEAAIAAGKRTLEAARRQGLRVVHVPCGPFERGYPELGPGLMGLRRAIPRAGTWQKEGPGAAFAQGFEPREGELVVAGRIGASAFAHSNLDALLRAQGVTHFYLAGFALHVCIESTLRQAHDLGYAVTLLSDGCAAFTAAQREHVLAHVVHHFGEALTTPAFLAHLQGAA
ncbi:cysteine hydrolase [Archangium violaceum]|uniref:cysteine hydrolase n=1 Tax=Archangium violaceum TaxID=83451 RepID=UPI00193AFCCC|nr:cysteine hydrolase [Archangium violaceum]QRK08426.1 cysteine hydrolase [Archangium violaceum]